MIAIESSDLVVEILPDVGGKIAQIHHRSSGRKYLVPAQRPYRTLALDGDWLQHDISGMDDCFPNVAAGRYPEAPWNFLQLPDLGEWTRGSWNVAYSSRSEVIMQRSGMVLPYSAIKTVRFLSERVLNISYAIRNNGEVPIRYLWSLHPLITVEGNYEIVLPPGMPRIRIFPADGVAYQWPIWKHVDLSRDFVAPGTTLKVFLSGLSEGWCELRQPSHSLRFVFDLEELPEVGIWFNNRGFPTSGNQPFRCIALEPCTSPTDLLDELEPHTYRSISAGGSVCWSVQIEIAEQGDWSAAITPD